MAGPLAGRRVAVVGGSLAGTLFGVVLAEFGAEVVKVEPPEGDPLRQVGPLVGGASLRWATTARGLRSATSDLGTAQGLDRLGHLMDRCDVVADATGGADRAVSGRLADARPPVLVRFRALSADSDSGAGTSTGRRCTASSLGDGLLAAAAGGLLHITGYPDGPPLPLGSDVVDHLGASYAAMATMAGLLRWQRTGQPCVVDAPLSGAVLRILEWTVSAYEADGTVRRREGNFPTAVAPIGLFPAADGQLVGIVGASDANFRRLTTVMERSDLLEDPRFATTTTRAANAKVINELVGRWVADRPGEEALRTCRRGGVIVALVPEVAQILIDPHVRARGDVVTVDDPLLGPLPVAAPQPHTPSHVATGADTGQMPPAPLLGADNQTVWQQWAALDGEQ